MSPEICIVVDSKDKRQFFFPDVKADVVIVTEGSNPGCVRVSIEGTTGVEEQGMSSRG